MAVVPWFMRDFYDDRFDPFSRLYDQDFAVGLLEDELRRPMFAGLDAPLRSGYMRALRHLQPEDSGVSTITNDRDAFKVNLDTKQFKPEEIKVKVADGYLVIDGKHEERPDKHGFISRQFSRRYKLPEDVRMEEITSQLSSDGELSICAPKKVDAVKRKERAIPIQKTNQPSLKHQQKKSNGEKMETS